MHHDVVAPPLVTTHLEGDRAVLVAVDVAPPRARYAPRSRDVVRDVRRRVLPGAVAEPGRSRLVPLAIVALGAGVVGTLLRGGVAGERRRRRRRLVGLGASLVLGAALARMQLGRLFAEEAPYEVELRDGDFELRRYPLLHVAATRVEGPFQLALDRGFRMLARFLFGGNVPQDPPTGAPAMDRAPRRLAMTTPVLAARLPDQEDAHVVSFVMPSKEGDATLPHPRDARVELGTLPARRVAVLRFRGVAGVATVRAKQEELFELVERAGLRPAAEPTFAAYDAPWTLPILRRFEIWLPIA